MSFRIGLLSAALLLGAALAGAQELAPNREFLTDHEIDLIRRAQEPNDRLAHYMHFAALRLELVSQLMAQDEAGRGSKVHDNLTEFVRIIEAVDLVIDDAVVDDVDLEKGLLEVTTQEPQFLAKLEKIKLDAPEDMWRYEFALEDAIDVTRMSAELAQEDLGDRKRGVIEADDRRAKERDATMSAARSTDVRKAKEKQEAKEEKVKSKRPTLYKKGEKPDEKKP